MNLLAISDLHLRSGGERNARLFEQFLRQAADRRDEVVIAGDLFDLWFGPSQLTFPYQKETLQVMEALAQNGLIMHYIEGNRDFSINHYKDRIFRSVSARSFDLLWAGKKIRFVHGDLVNSADRMYRLWRSVSKNRFSLFLLDHMPSSFLKASSKMEEGMKATNQKYKSFYPEREAQEFCRHAALEGVEILIAGHFHIERETKMQFDKKNVLFYTLPGWESGFRYLIIPGEGNKPHFAELGR
jgi:UDP-2,3-diacylglucosamine hydrolase